VSAAEDDNHVMDVYVRDRSAGTTNLVSTGIGWPPGDLQSGPANDPHRSRVARQSGDGPSYEAVISADGNFVAFTSEASNLGPGIGDMNSLPDVYVRNRSTWKIRRVSVTSAEAERAWYANADAISAHGRFVAFTWDDNFRLHLMVRDRSAGTTRQIARNSSVASMSAHGRLVTFTKPISVGVGWDPDGSETGKPYKVLRWNRSTGQTQRVSVSDSEQPGNSGSFGAALTVRGGHVAFTSIATNLVVGDTNHRADVFVRDRAAGRTARISVNSTGGQGNGASREPAVSATGRYVAFTSHASNLVARDPNGHGSDVFVRDRKTGRTHLVSARGNFRPSTSTRPS
jgi:Tol biopolymer transport system component